MAKKGRRISVFDITPEELLQIYLKMTPQEREKNFWITKKVALLLGKRDSTVRGMIRKGDFLALRIGGTLHIYMPTVVEWMKATAAAA